VRVFFPYWFVNNNRKESQMFEIHLTCENLPQSLTEIDLKIAEEERAKGCRYCRGTLHWSSFGRKPRGGPASWNRRHSFCCYKCDRRFTPPSVRFFGRRVYVGYVLVLTSAMLHGADGNRLEQLRRALKIDPRTFKRWLHWWRNDFVAGPFWKAAKTRFNRPVSEKLMPLSLCKRFGATTGGVVKLMEFLAPAAVSRFSQSSYVK
jgi:hypothetical protein